MVEQAEIKNSIKWNIFEIRHILKQNILKVHNMKQSDAIVACCTETRVDKNHDFYF